MKTKPFAIALLLVLVAPAAWAAPSQDRGPSPALRPEVLKGMSLEDLLAGGETAVRDMNSMVKEVLDALQAAQDKNDFARINCVGEVVATIKGLLRLSDQNALTLRERVIARDRTNAEHEYVKIGIARGKVVDLLAQAKGCGGPSAETVFEGSPVLQRAFDSDLPVDDPKVGLAQPVVTIEPPPSASPYF